jgi:hypothetical protein
MCFSFEVSLGTFLFSWGVSFYLLRKNLTKYQRQNVIFLMIFSSMQIPDAILWYNKMKKNKINLYTTSYFIPFLLSLQLVYNNFIRLETYETLDTIVRLMTLYAVYRMFIRYRGYSIASCDSYFSSPMWSGKELEFYILLIFGFLISYPHYDRALIGLLSLIVLQLITKSGYGSMWCAIANSVAVYYLYKY